MFIFIFGVIAFLAILAGGILGGILCQWIEENFDTTPALIVAVVYCLVFAAGYVYTAVLLAERFKHV